MSRPRSLPDSEVFAAILRLIATEGERAVAFSSVARASGLAGATLAQRYGSVARMIEAAHLWAWDQAAREAAQVAEGVAARGKGAQALLKGLDGIGLPFPEMLAAAQRSAPLRDRAAEWRRQVCALLALHLGDSERAAMVFALWQGRHLWGPQEFSLKDALKRL